MAAMSIVPPSHTKLAVSAKRHPPNRAIRGIPTSTAKHPYPREAPAEFKVRQPRNRNAATTTAAIAMPAVTRRHAKRDSSCASAVSKCARVTSSPMASVLASRATSTTATASASSAPASVNVFTAACVSKGITGSVSRDPGERLGPRRGVGQVGGMDAVGRLSTTTETATGDEGVFVQVAFRLRTESGKCFCAGIGPRGENPTDVAPARLRPTLRRRQGTRSVADLSFSTRHCGRRRPRSSRVRRRRGLRGPTACGSRPARRHNHDSGAESPHGSRRRASSFAQTANCSLTTRRRTCRWSDCGCARAAKASSTTISPKYGSLPTFWRRSMVRAM